MSGTGPLTGVRVLDMTQFEAGTVCTETLAWMGAEVWKVERPVKGEQGRYSFVSPDKDGFGFILLNLNKESITCNAKKPEGLALMKRLAAEAIEPQFTTRTVLLPSSGVPMVGSNVLFSYSAVTSKGLTRLAATLQNVSAFSAAISSAVGSPPPFSLLSSSLHEVTAKLRPTVRTAISR